MSHRETELRKAMCKEMFDLIGDGYVPSYYEQLAAPFIQIALAFAANERVHPDPDLYMR